MSHVSAALQALTRGRRQQDVADAIGIPRTTLTQYRLGMRPPTVGALEQMLRAFGEEEQRVLVKAYLDDETPAPWFGRVQIAFAQPAPAPVPAAENAASRKRKTSAAPARGADSARGAAPVPDMSAPTGVAVAGASGLRSAAGAAAGGVADKELSTALAVLTASARARDAVRQVLLDLAMMV
jgi:transcriptional regulator with XRE-family HTH domain